MSDVRREAPTAGAPRVAQQRGYHGPPESSTWTGWVMFGAMLMILLGTFQVIAGLVALFDKGYYVVSSRGLAVHVDYTAWGWVHLIVGLVAMAAGFGLFNGATWARVLGIGVAGLSAIINFAFMAAYPLWSITMIGLDVVIIYAIAAHGRELQVRS